MRRTSNVLNSNLLLSVEQREYVFYYSVKSGPFGWKDSEIYASLRVTASQTAHLKTQLTFTERAKSCFRSFNKYFLRAWYGHSPVLYISFMGKNTQETSNLLKNTRQVCKLCKESHSGKI